MAKAVLWHFPLATLYGKDSFLSRLLSYLIRVIRMCCYMWFGSFLKFIYQYDFYFSKQPVSLKLQLRVS